MWNCAIQVQRLAKYTDDCDGWMCRRVCVQSIKKDTCFVWKLCVTQRLVKSKDGCVGNGCVGVSPCVVFAQLQAIEQSTVLLGFAKAS